MSNFPASWTDSFNVDDNRFYGDEPYSQYIPNIKPSSKIPDLEKFSNLL